MRYLLTCALLCFTALPTLADEPAEGRSLFNGKDLTGWTGRSDLWSVEEGAIVGQTSDENPIDTNTFLIYEGDVPGDFELHAQFKILGGNSGIQYRSRVIDRDKFIVGGYQADIDDALRFAGINYDERGRGILAQRGTRTTILPDGTKQEEIVGDSEELGEVIRPGEWNQYRIVARGNTLEHYINDTLMSAVIDQQQEEAERDGVLALQLHRGPAMRVEFKDIRVRTLAGPDDGAAAPQSSIDVDKLGAIRAKMQQLVKEQKIAGAIAAVVHRGEEVYFTAVGNARPGEQIGRDDLFRIASMTKPIVSVAAMQMVEQGKIALDDPVSKYVPVFADAAVAAPGGNEPVARPVLVRDLLTHTSGITYRFAGRDPVSGCYKQHGVEDGLREAQGTQLENVARIAACPLLFQPGTGWEYGLSVDVLGAVLAAADERPLDEVLKARIFEPLGMKDTHFNLPKADHARLCALYRPDPDNHNKIMRVGDQPQQLGELRWTATYPTHPENKFFSGGAGLVSSLDDYLRFCRALLAGGELEGNRILSEETVEQMATDQIGNLPIRINAHGNGFGYGFGVVTKAPQSKQDPSLGTYSWAGIFNTAFFIDPQTETIGVMMCQLFPFDHTRLREHFQATVNEALDRG